MNTQSHTPSIFSFQQHLAQWDGGPSAFAKALGTTKAQILRYAGGGQRPSASRRREIASLFKVPEEALFGNQHNPEVKPSYGEVKEVRRITVERRMGPTKKGYSSNMVSQVLNGKKSNPAIIAIYEELAACKRRDGNANSSPVVVSHDYNGNEIRTLLIDERQWFIALDVSRLLEYTSAGALLHSLRHTDDIRRASVKTSGPVCNMHVVSPQGLLRVLLRSVKPGARDFSQWITQKLLPNATTEVAPEKGGVQTTETNHSVAQGTLPPARLKDIEESGYDYFDVGWPAQDPPKGDASATAQLYFHLHHTKGLVNDLTERLTKLENETATPAVLQNHTTAIGTVSTPSTRTLAKLSEANAQLAEESTQLMARNAAMEENTLHVQAELRKREEQLVEAGKDAEVVARECEALRAANTNLLEEVEELQKQNETTARDLATAYKDRDQLRAMNSRNAERMYEAEAKAEELEADNTRLRRALLEQATVYATTLKALLPQA